MGIIKYTNTNLLRMLKQVVDLVLQNWSALADAPFYSTHVLELESGDEIKIEVGYGLCDWLERYLEEADMNEIYGSWKFFSGSPTYPVGGYVEYHGINHKYHSDDRRALCEWVQECVANELSARESSHE